MKEFVPAAVPGRNGGRSIHPSRQSAQTSKKISTSSICSIRIRRDLRNYCSGSVARRSGERFLSQNPKLLLGNHFAENGVMSSCRVARRCGGRSTHPFRQSTKFLKTTEKQFVSLNMYVGVMEESPRRTPLIP